MTATTSELENIYNLTLQHSTRIDTSPLIQLYRDVKDTPKYFAAFLLAMPYAVVNLLEQRKISSFIRLHSTVKDAPECLKALVDGISEGVARLLAKGCINDFTKLHDAVKDDPIMLAALVDGMPAGVAKLMEKGFIREVINLHDAVKDDLARVATIYQTGVFFCPANAIPKDRGWQSYDVLIHVRANGVELHFEEHYFNRRISSYFRCCSEDIRLVADNRREVYVPIIMGLLQQAINSPHLPETLQGVAASELQARQRQWRRLTGQIIIPRAFA